MRITKIYFDMDGVLADFRRGIIELCGIQPPDQNTRADPAADDAMWAKVRDIEHFYDKLELMDGSKEMFDTLYNDYGSVCEILSAIPKPRRGILNAAEDKANWVHRLLDESVKVNIVMREEKRDYCTGKDCILIDDLEKNIKEWEAMGGTGILFTNAKEVVGKIKELEEL